MRRELGFELPSRWHTRLYREMTICAEWLHLPHEAFRRLPHRERSLWLLYEELRRRKRAERDS